MVDMQAIVRALLIARGNGLRLHLLRFVAIDSSFIFHLKYTGIHDKNIESAAVLDKLLGEGYNLCK